MNHEWRRLTVGGLTLYQVQVIRDGGLFSSGLVMARDKREARRMLQQRFPHEDNVCLAVPIPVLQPEE